MTMKAAFETKLRLAREEADQTSKVGYLLPATDFDLLYVLCVFHWYASAVFLLSWNTTVPYGVLSLLLLVCFVHKLINVHYIAVQ